MLKTNKQQQQMKTKGEKISHTHPTPFCKIVPLMQAQRYTLNGMNRFARNCSPTHWRALSFSLCVSVRSQYSVVAPHHHLLLPSSLSPFDSSQVSTLSSWSPHSHPSFSFFRSPPPLLASRSRKAFHSFFTRA